MDNGRIFTINSPLFINSIICLFVRRNKGIDFEINDGNSQH